MSKFFFQFWQLGIKKAFWVILMLSPKFQQEEPK